MRAVLLTGGLATGKTTVAADLGELLQERGRRVAVIDLDWLCWTSAGDVHGLLTANLRAVAANYTAAGVTELVLARALLEPAHLTAVTDALPGWTVRVIRLSACAATVAARLRGRDGGAILDGHLAEAAAFQKAVETAGVEEAVVANDGRPVRAVAAEIEALLST
ncbi:hypothetical protein GCM10027589_55950 [Actinocorallia lasiicapitis]